MISVNSTTSVAQRGPSEDGNTAVRDLSAGSNTDRKSVIRDVSSRLCRLGVNHSPASGVIWVVGVWTTVLWGVGETTWMDTSELPGWGISGKSVRAEPTGDKQEAHL